MNQTVFPFATKFELDRTQVQLSKHEREHVMQKLIKKGKVDNMCPGPACCTSTKRQKTSA